MSDKEERGDQRGECEFIHEGMKCEEQAMVVIGYVIVEHGCWGYCCTHTLRMCHQHSNAINQSEKFFVMRFVPFR